MKLNILPILFSTLFISTTYGFDLSGKWKTIDDKTGYSRANVEITKNADGTYHGKIISIKLLPGKSIEDLQDKCIACKGNLKNAPYVGLEIINGFVQNPKNPNEYINGKVLDPITGNVYSGKAKINDKNTRLSMRGYIGISAIGRSVTWIRLE